MSYKHGIYGMELPTKVVPPIVSTAGLPVVFGTAPINLAKNPAEVNKPTLIYSYEEAVEKFGYSDDWGKYTLSEFMYSQFVLFGRAPVVLVNVLDKENHTKVGNEEIKLVDGKVVLKTKEVIAETVVATIKGEENTLILNKDYVLSFNNDGTLNFISLSDKIKNSTINLVFNTVDVSKVSEKDIIGGVDISTGKKTGLELISEVYPKFRVVPGSILAPKFSSNPEVAAILNSKARKINGLFNAIALVDAPSNLQYSDIPEWKNENNIVEDGQILFYPKLKLGDKVFHMSTQMAGVICATDEKMGDIPYKSPSNESLKTNATVNDNGELFLGIEEANYLNGQGIVTAINFNGWKSWGNRMACYPTKSDVKDTFIPIRRMFDWVLNTLILTYWSKIDDPMNKRLVETIVDSANLWLNGLASSGAVIGARVAFENTDNPVTDLMDGKIKFHVYLTPPSPAKEIVFIQEYDANYITQFANELGGSN